MLTESTIGNEYKEVRWDKYCYDCKYCDQAITVKPCPKCLDASFRLNSEKPEKFEAKERG